MFEFEPLASFKTHPDLHIQFRSEELYNQWAHNYPMLFDSDDLRIAISQASMGYHYYEWLSAILIYHTLGKYSLIEQYQFKSHQRKYDKLIKLTTIDAIDFIRSHPEFGEVQCPDLLVYEPDFSDWYFCEVKGPNDRLRETQIEFFMELSKRTNKPIKTVEFEYITDRDKKT